MSHQTASHSEPTSWVDAEPSRPSLQARHSSTLERLRLAFERREPLAVLTSDSRSDISEVIGQFVEGLDEAADTVLIREPCIDTIANMREIVDGIGFKPKDMNQSDLENILAMFLSFQKRNGRRTVIAYEETQENGWWVLDNIRRIVDLELSQNSGLMIVLGGSSSVLELFEKQPLNALDALARTRIKVAPLSEAETREYVRQQIENTGQFDIGEVFDFMALARVHELSQGVPDAVETLCGKCLEMVTHDQNETITIEMVEFADQLLKEPGIVADDTVVGQHLIARMNGELILKRAFDRGRILIGRDKLCDIRLPSRYVSRHQALLVKSSYGIKVLDLGSRNGSFVNGKPFRDYTLKDGDVVTFGDCTIEYIA